jgi:hypothetical protein
MPFKLKIDSGFYWTMIPTRDCRTCNKFSEGYCREAFKSSDEKYSCGEGYDPSEAFATLIDSVIHGLYGTTNLTGKVWVGTLCSNDLCVVDFPFFSYHKEKTRTQYPSKSSVLGLAPKKFDTETGPLFVDYLYQ